MRKILTATFALVLMCASAATYKQASQAWVEMKLDQLRLNLIQALGSQYSSSYETVDTNAPTSSVIANATNRAIADAMPIASMLATPVEVVATSNSIPCFFCGGASSSLTNYISYGLYIPMVSQGVYSTNGISVVTSGGTNTLSILSGLYTLTAETNNFYFTSSGGNDFAYLYMTYIGGENE